MKQSFNGMPNSALAVALCVCLQAACTPTTNTPTAGPLLSVTAATQTPAVFEGITVTLAAAATGGTPPYSFRWDQNAGPTQIDLPDPRQAALAAGPLTEPGRYVFRIMASDAVAAHATDFVAVEVGRTVETDVPRLIVVGEPSNLMATKTAAVNTVEFRWEITQGQGTIDGADTAIATLTAAAAETLHVELTTSIPTPNGESASATRSFDVVSVPSLAPRADIVTNFGDLTLELEGAAAPLHTANFLQYVDEGFYEGLVFHRHACEPEPDTGACLPFVLQGGGYESLDGSLELREPTQETVRSEADNGLTNADRLTVSLALSEAGPDSGTAQFFINLKDNAFLDDQGFTVFARLTGGEPVLDEILAIETTESPIIPGEPSLPIEDVLIERIMRVDGPGGE